MTIMYLILVYDIDAKRVSRMLKLCRRYLHWIQNSVFEGEITGVKLKELIQEAKGIMSDKDSLIIFKTRNEKWLDKEVYGAERNKVQNII